MAGDEVHEERRGDTVAVSRKAFAFGSAVASSSVVLIGVALFGLAITSERHTQQLSQLIEFGPKTGDRWTKRQADDQKKEFREELLILRQQVRDLHNEISKHNGKQAHDVANNRLQSMQQSIQRLREDYKDCCKQERK
jgi:predicted PurR-regulated permease PerM